MVIQKQSLNDSRFVPPVLERNDEVTSDEGKLCRDGLTGLFPAVCTDEKTKS